MTDVCISADCRVSPTVVMVDAVSPGEKVKASLRGSPNGLSLIAHPGFSRPVMH